MFRILCEEKIPYAREAFSSLGEVSTLPVHDIVRDALRETDILLVRSGTRIDAALLDGTPVRYVATATAGTDHVDRDYLAARHIPFAHAPGCNADAVVEYVIAALYHLGRTKQAALAGKTIGIVGCGHVGGRLAARLPALGLNVLCCDPPLAEAGSPMALHAYEAVLEAADILTFHTPLVRDGAYPTYHLLDASGMQRMKPGAWLINASRGPVVDGRALEAAIDAGRFGAVVLDVWEGEPEVRLDLMRKVDLATPHIAGHSFEGKVNGTIMLYEALQQYLGMSGTWQVEDVLAPGPGDHLELAWPAAAGEAALHDLVHQMYDITADDRTFRTAYDLPADAQGAFFRRLRKDYPRRRTFAMFTVAPGTQDAATRRALRDGLRVQVSAGA
ncbi:MAG: 4-phosphoerythronate dehydrogenase [Rhodothermales bacterium]